MENENIKKLEELLKEGILSQEEFESKKATILENTNTDEEAYKDEVEKPVEKSNSKKLIIGIFIIVISVAGYILSTQPTKLEEAYRLCQVDSVNYGLYAMLDTDGKGLYLDGYGEENTLGIPVYTQICVLDVLDMPRTVRNKIENTNSLMGVRTAEWDDMYIEWTYHPDSGLNITLEED